MDLEVLDRRHIQATPGGSQRLPYGARGFNSQRDTIQNMYVSITWPRELKTPGVHEKGEDGRPNDNNASFKKENSNYASWTVQLLILEIIISSANI